MIKLTKYELKQIAGNRGIKNYQNMSDEKLLDVTLKYDRITESLSQNGLKKIARMENLSQNDFEQIQRMNNLSLNKLKQIAKTRCIKTNRNTSKKDLLIALLKSNQSPTELRRGMDNSNTEIEETKKIFNELRNNFSKKEIEKIKIKFHNTEKIDKYLKELEQKDSLTKEEKQEKKRYTKKLQKHEKSFKKVKRKFKQIRKASIQ